MVVRLPKKRFHFSIILETALDGPEWAVRGYALTMLGDRAGKCPQGTATRPGDD
jgi:hypothetical protein